MCVCVCVYIYIYTYTVSIDSVRNRAKSNMKKTFFNQQQ